MAEKALTIDEVIEDLEKEALALAKKAGALENEKASEDVRKVLRRILSRNEAPNPDVCNKIALFMLNWYSATDLSHNHSGDVLDVKSIGHEWARKGLTSLSGKISFSWQNSHVETPDAEENKKDQQIQPVKEVAMSTESNAKLARKARREGSWKDRMMTNGKQALNRALIRKAARNLSEMGQGGIMMMLDTGNDTDPGLKSQIKLLLSTDVGRAVVAFAISAAVDYVPIPGLSDDLREALVLELQTEAMDNATLPIEKVVKAMVPMLTTAVSPLLTGGDAGGDVKQMKSAEA